MLIFIGYDSRSKGYKWYNPRNSKIIIKRDVEFDEANSWDWSSPKEVGLFFFFFLSLSWKMRSKQVKLTPSSMEQVQVKEYKARGAFEKYIMSQNR
jgi:hypothetical protein